MKEGFCKFKINHLCMAVAVIGLLLAGCSETTFDNPNSRAADSSSENIELVREEARPGPIQPGHLTNVVTGKVIKVVDGDTIDILMGGNRKTRVRFHGIDAPEAGQPFGRNAKSFVAQAVGAKIARSRKTDTDRYGRVVGEVLIGDQRLSVQMVQAGLAWHWTRYAPTDAELGEAERDARQNKRGLWSDKRHVAPWDWRKLSKKERDKLR